ncbi:DUF6318 family protein [Dermabacteraceae bacterium P9123]
MEAKMLSAKALPIYAATVAAALSLMLTGCGQGSEATTPTPGTGQAEQKQAAPARPKPEEKPDPDDPQVTGLPRADYDGSGPSGIYKGIPPAPPDPADFPGMNENTDAGAIQTLKYWDMAMSYSIATGDISYAKKYTSNECDNCIATLSNIVSQHKRGIYGKSKSITHSDASVGLEKGRKVYYVTSDVEGFSAVEDRGKTQSEAKDELYRFAAYMDYRNNQWQVVGLSFAREGDEESGAK